MNTNKLKVFARAARTKLIADVTAKLNWVLSHKESNAELLGNRRGDVAKLEGRITAVGAEQVIDEVAYTWFNRLVALRFMDANGYNMPCVVTPSEGMTFPEVLQDAKSGHIDDKFSVARAKIADILDGRAIATSGNPESDVYRMLLVSACNSWNGAMPFMFEQLNSYIDLLLSDDLLSDNSIVAIIREGMSSEDCAQEELIGWLYQFYISEVNERLIQSKKKYNRNELAPASQLFTPHWIVRYMVDNTLGQFWSEMYPESKLIESLAYYIKPDKAETLPKREVKSIEDIKFYDPCVGSAHILTYAYDVFYKMYEELGYANSEIPKLIIENNLWGTDIDPRAAQLSSFVLMMKGFRSYSRFLRKEVKTNISYYKDFEQDDKFKKASSLGSLINISEEELVQITSRKRENNLFDQNSDNNHLIKLYQTLGQRYDLVVTNPPYIPSSRLDDETKRFIEDNYSATKSDLFATFVLRCLELCNEDGLTGYMTPFVWMFISSYEKLRRAIIENHQINNLIQLEYSGFDGATVPICTFTLRNNKLSSTGCYIRLSDFKGSVNQAPRTLEAIQNRDCGWFYIADQKNFEKIPGSPIGYWVSDDMIIIMSHKESIADVAQPRKGLVTLNDNYFFKFWNELNLQDVQTPYKLKEEVLAENRKWVFCNKGGGSCKWYGMNMYALKWHNNGEELKQYIVEKYKGGSYTKEIRSENLYFNEGVTWGGVTSGLPTFRYFPTGYVFSSSGPSAFTNNNIYYLLGFLNSVISTTILKVYSPTLSVLSGDIANLPYLECKDSFNIESIVKSNISISKQDWDAHETSWDFKQNELTRFRKVCGEGDISLEFLYNEFTIVWEDHFKQLHFNEEELNRQFIEIYGLQDELTPDVPLKEITILQQGEIKIEENEIVFQPAVVLKQFMSYAVGCMMGRYSIDEAGLIVANQGEGVAEYLEKIPNPTFMPDDDGIIPVLEGEYFLDDLTERFKMFMLTLFGEKYCGKNLNFILAHVGDIRKYFYKDFYNDHVKMYKKRPIYWMFSSPKKHFQVLVYMHRMRSDTPSKVFNDYLQPFIHKLEAERYTLQNELLRADITPREKASTNKRVDQLSKMLLDSEEYAKTLLAFASTRPTIDLDDGVKVNYTKFKGIVTKIVGLE